MEVLLVWEGRGMGRFFTGAGENRWIWGTG